MKPLSILNFVEILYDSKYEPYSEIDIIRLTNSLEKMHNVSTMISCVKFIDFALFEYCYGNTKKGVECFGLIKDIIKKQFMKKLCGDDGLFYIKHYGDIGNISYRKYIGGTYTHEEQKEYGSFILFIYCNGFRPTDRFKKFISSDIHNFINI